MDNLIVNDVTVPLTKFNLFSGKRQLVELLSVKLKKEFGLIVYHHFCALDDYTTIEKRINNLRSRDDDATYILTTQRYDVLEYFGYGMDARSTYHKIYQNRDDKLCIKSYDYEKFKMLFFEIKLEMR